MTLTQAFFIQTILNLVLVGSAGYFSRRRGFRDGYEIGFKDGYSAGKEYERSRRNQ